MRIVLIWDTDQVGWLVTAPRQPPPGPSFPLISQNTGEMYSSCQALQFTHFPCLSAFPFSSVFHRSGFVLGSALIPSQPLLQAGRVHFLQGTVFPFWPVIKPPLLPTAQHKQGDHCPSCFIYLLLYMLLFQFISTTQNYRCSATCSLYLFLNLELLYQLQASKSFYNSFVKL